MKDYDGLLHVKDGSQIFYKVWEPDEEPKAIVQICHGLAEHIQAYDEFGTFLAERGVLAIGSDHRGHGQNIRSEDKSGYFGSGSGWNNVLSDIKELTSTFKDKYPNTPIFLFGHSMGSFLARNYIQSDHTDLKGAIICGTGGFPRPIGSIGINIAKTVAKLYGPTHKSKLLDNMSFGSYNKSFKPNRTSFDWLSRDDSKVDSYINDPLRGYIASSQLFIDILTALKDIDSIPSLIGTDKDFPISIISGDKDPVGDMGKYIPKLYSDYINNGFTRVSYKLYKDCRHELINEVNRVDIMKDIYEWIMSLI